ncbi:MAG: M15 family metallopeptidase [Cupriavidus sp.]|nr:M15 family metallopeptidase [Cupriavidus sp.]
MEEISEKRLQGVHPDLVRVVRRAYASLPKDLSFRVAEGLRSRERQAMLVDAGKSQTMNSRHLTGHAVDLAPLVNNAVSWDWEHFYPMADVVAEAAKHANVPLVWGGAWGRIVQQWPHGSSKKAQDAYVAARKTAGLRPFLDGPHFELDRNRYP